MPTTDHPHMTHWSYRIVRTDAGDGEALFTVIEAYFDGERMVGWCPAEPRDYGNLESLDKALENMRSAIAAGLVVDAADLPS